MKSPSTLFSIPLIFIEHLLYNSNCHQAYKNEYSSCPLGNYNRKAERIWKGYNRKAERILHLRASER